MSFDRRNHRTVLTSTVRNRPDFRTGVLLVKPKSTRPSAHISRSSACLSLALFLHGRRQTHVPPDLSYDAANRAGGLFHPRWRLDGAFRPLKRLSDSPDKTRHHRSVLRSEFVKWPAVPIGTGRSAGVPSRRVRDGRTGPRSTYGATRSRGAARGPDAPRRAHRRHQRFAVGLNALLTTRRLQPVACHRGTPCAGGPESAPGGRAGEDSSQPRSASHLEHAFGGRR